MWEYENQETTPFFAMWFLFVWFLFVTTTTHAAPGCQSSCVMYAGTNGRDAAPFDMVQIAETMPQSGPWFQARGSVWNARRFNTQLLSTPNGWFAYDTYTGDFALAGDGTYHIQASAGGYSLGFHVLRLLNATDGVTVVAIGTTEASNTASITARSLLETVVVVPPTHTLQLRLQHWATGGTSMSLGNTVSAPSMFEYFAFLTVRRVVVNATGAIVTPVVSVPVLPQIWAQGVVTTTQVTSGSTVSSPVFLTGASATTYGISINTAVSSVSRFWMPYAGTYFVSVSLQHTGTTATATNMETWMRFNGGDLSYTTHSSYLSAANDIKALSYSLLLSLAAKDNIEVFYYNSQTTHNLPFISSASSPLRSAVAATILNVVRLDPSLARGAFYNTASSQTGSTSAATIVLCPTAHTIGGTATGVSVGGTGGRLILAAAGTYLFSYQVHIRGAATQLNLWLRRDGTTDLPYSNTRWVLTSTTDFQVVSQQYLIQTTGANQYVEAMWLTGDTGAVIRSLAAGASPTRPGSPGVTFQVFHVPYNVYFMGYHTATQTTSSTTSAVLMDFNTDVMVQGLTHSPSTRLTIQTAGTYHVALTVHLQSTNAGIITWTAWLVSGGGNLANSGATQKVASSSDLRVLTRTYTLRLAADAYLEVQWHCDSTTGQLYTSAAGAIAPATPSARLVVYQVSTDV